MDPADILMTVLFTLFVASTVNERIIDFIKLRFPVLWLKSVNPKDEIRRHQYLWLLAFGMGVVTTALLDINIVHILTAQQNGDTIVGFLDWIVQYKDKWYVLGWGYLFTALFISLGSKFWHDLLDIVLFVKNSRRKIDAFKPEGIYQIEQIDDYLKENEYEVAVKALEANRDKLEKQFGTDSIYLGYEHVNGQYRWSIVLMICKQDKDGPLSTKSRQSSIDYITNYGYVFRFPVLVKNVGLAYTADDSEPMAVAGGGLFNSAKPDNVGTFGCIVKDVKDGCEDLMLLTCCHCVLIPGQHSWTGIDHRSINREVRYKANANDNLMPVVGEINRAYRNGRMDVAFIKAKSNDLIRDYLTSSGKLIPVGSRAVNNKDIMKKTRVWFSGARSGNCEGFIIHINCTVPINYAGEEAPYKIRNLIAFSQRTSEPHLKPCDKGDSGTIILEADTYKALGMIVAIDDQFGYAIPISDILKSNDLALFSDPCEFQPT